MPFLEANVADRFDSAGKFISKTRRFPARGAGSMATSAEDLARFASALLEDRIISRQSRAAMLRGLLTKTPFGPAFFKEGHGDGAQNYLICFEQRKACMILLTNSDNGERTFRALLEKIFGDTVTPWEWEGY